MEKAVLLVLLGILYGISHVDGLQKIKSNVVKIECFFNPVYLYNTTCKLKPIKRSVKLLQFGGTTLRPVHAILLRIAHFKKNHVNRFIPGLFDITQDYFELTKRTGITFKFFNTFVDQFYKQHATEILALVQGCPAHGSYFYRENRKETDASIHAAFLGSGEYKLTISLHSAKNNVTVGSIDIFSVLKDTIESSRD